MTTHQILRTLAALSSLALGCGPAPSITPAPLRDDLVDQILAGLGERLPSPYQLPNASEVQMEFVVDLMVYSVDDDRAKSYSGAPPLVWGGPVRESPSEYVFRLRLGEQGVFHPEAMSAMIQAAETAYDEMLERGGAGGESVLLRSHEPGHASGELDTRFTLLKTIECSDQRLRIWRQPNGELFCDYSVRNTQGDYQVEAWLPNQSELLAAIRVLNRGHRECVALRAGLAG